MPPKRNSNTKAASTSERLSFGAFDPSEISPETWARVASLGEAAGKVIDYLETIREDHEEEWEEMPKSMLFSFGSFDPKVLSKKASRKVVMPREQKASA